MSAPKRLTRRQLITLAILYTEGALPRNVLAYRLDTSPEGASRTCASLVRLGLVCGHRTRSGLLYGLTKLGVALGDEVSVTP